jgi:hypothetical protein
VPGSELVDDGPGDEGEALVAFGEHDEGRRRRRTVRKLPWAELLQRVFGIDALKCPMCNGRMRVNVHVGVSDVWWR